MVTTSTLRPAGAWLPVIGYEGKYEVSDHADVWSRLSNKRLKLTPQPSGHLRVSLSRDGRRQTFLVHRLMLEAFKGACPPGMEALHDNDIGSDNALDNLSWGTRSQNQLDAVRNGRNHNANKTVCTFGHPLDQVVTRGDGSTYRRCSHHNEHVLPPLWKRGWR